MNKQTKIVCTIGPSSQSYEMIKRLAKEGMNVARLNFSHGSHEEHGAKIKTIRKVMAENNMNIGIMLDTSGPEIRLGDFEKDKEEYQAGDIVTVCKEEILGTHDRFTIRCKELFDDIKPGNYILVNDGKERLTVLENNGEEMKCRVEVNGYLSSHKNCNVPGVKLTMPFISKKDYDDIVFGCEMDVDYIAASFTRRAEDVQDIRKIITQMGKPKIQIIAKIENEEGYENLDEILEAADGVMVARGDFGMEVETAKVPFFQKKMIALANHYGKPVVTATQMLDSMMVNPMCTRAEASDVYNAVLDGSDAVMLSGETAGGNYPVEAVRTMSSIVMEAEKHVPYSERLEAAKRNAKKTIQDAIAISISDATLQLDIAAIVAFTQSGQNCHKLSEYRPDVPIYAVTFDHSVQSKLQLCWGVVPQYSKVRNDLSNEVELACSVAKSNGIKEGSLIIICAGYPQGVGSTNTMKIVSVK
ncbi:MAG: pyruvate kinase [Erysipelotrichaceae bacterium]|nr:pyruvate kinase [Erysipelotrichaceae bacterium]